MKNRLLSWAYPVSIALVATAVASFFLTRPAGAPALASKNLNPEQEKSGALLDQWKTFGFAGPQTRTDSLAAALDLYQQYQYPAAENALHQYLDAHAGDSIALFYLGLSLLYQENFRAATDILSPLAALEAFDLREDALWYSAMAATNADPQKAIELFEKISRDAGSRYQQAAAAILASLRMNAGSCAFRVQQNKAADGERIAAASLAFVVDPAWWQRWWARTALMFFCLGGAVSIVVWRKREKQRTLENIERAVFMRTQNIRLQKEQIEKEKERSEELLLNILPAETAEELKKYGHSDTRRYEMVTVLFCDFQEFTRLSEEMSPEDLVASLGECFEAYDRIVTAQGLEKIKTVGDCYICAGGLHAQDADSAAGVVRAAREMLEFLKGFNARQAAAGKPAFEARIGIHTGPVVAGIVGIKKYAYDIWGDTVNIAARMEQSSAGGRINISEATYALVKDRFPCTYRGKVEAKGKGMVDMYFVE